MEFSCEETPESLKAGDLVFTVAEGVPGDIERNPSHVAILSRDYADKGQLVVCGHTADQLDAVKRRDDTRCTYIHIEQIAFDFSAEDYADERDRVTAAYELGERILKRRAAKDSRVKRLQKRLAYLGYDAGEPDGVFGAQTEAAVRGFQKISGAQFGLKVDGIVGDQTKEALTYPRKWIVIRDSGRERMFF